MPLAQHPSFSCMNVNIKLAHVIGDPSRALLTNLICPTATWWVTMDPKFCTTNIATIYIIRSMILEILNDLSLFLSAAPLECRSTKISTVLYPIRVGCITSQIPQIEILVKKYISFCSSDNITPSINMALSSPLHIWIIDHRNLYDDWISGQSKNFKILISRSHCGTRLCAQEPSDVSPSIHALATRSTSSLPTHKNPIVHIIWPHQNVQETSKISQILFFPHWCTCPIISCFVSITIHHTIMLDQHKQYTLWSC